MKLRGVLALWLLIQAAWCRVFESEITFASFRRGGGWVYLTKMTLQQGEMQVIIDTRITGVPFSTLQPFELVIVNQNNWSHQLEKKCRATSDSFRTPHSLSPDGTSTVQTYKISIPQEKSYYFVLRDCSSRLVKQYSNNNLHLHIRLSIMNNDSHLSNDEDNWFIFPLMFAICGWLIFHNKRDNIWGQDFDWAKFLLLASVGTNLSALFWKAVGFTIYSYNGRDYALFDIFYLGLHSLSETVVLCLIVMIAYGWTINYLNGEDFDLYIPLSNIFDNPVTMMGLLNTIVTILNKINDADHDKYHMYDSIPGYLLIGFRCIIMIVYIVGIVMTYHKSNPKKRPFIVQFGILGLLYVVSLPLLIILTEIFVKERSQKEFLFISVETLKAVSTILLTYMITSKKSSYAKICYRSLSFLPQNQKFF